jgi:hypothetical protein
MSEALADSADNIAVKEDFHELILAATEISVRESNSLSDVYAQFQLHHIAGLHPLFVQSRSIMLHRLISARRGKFPGTTLWSHFPLQILGCVPPRLT